MTSETAAPAAGGSRPAVWVEAARPKTLPAAIAPVLVGTAAASTFVAWRFAAALTVGLAMQIGVNFANDYFDAATGVDTSQRLGPRRAVASGLIAPERMRAAMIAAFAVAGAAGLALAAAVGWELAIAGVLAVLAALGYSGGPAPYGAAGLGEVAVFVFFGLVATVGSQYVQDEAVAASAVAAAVAMGLLASAILVANNLRDIDTDRRAGKVTLAVRLGRRGTAALYTSLIALAALSGGLVAVVAVSWWPLLCLVSLPLAVGPHRAMHRATDAGELIDALAATARFQLAFGVALAAGLWLGP